MSLALNHRQSTFFRATPYTSLISGDKVNGKVREFGHLSFAVVYEAGHLISVDSPGVALDLFRRAVWGRDLATGEKTLDELVEIPLTPDAPGVPDESGDEEDDEEIVDGWIGEDVG